jgi:hypothetical protein
VEYLFARTPTTVDWSIGLDTVTLFVTRNGQEAVLADFSVRKHFVRDLGKGRILVIV